MDKKAEELLKQRFIVKENSHGAELKILQNKYVNMMGAINELKDRLNLDISARKARITDIEAMAIIAVKKTEEFAGTKSIVMGKVLNAMVRTYPVVIPYQKALDEDSPAEIVASTHDGTPVTIRTTVSNEEHMLLKNQFMYDRAKSKAEELNQVLWVCRSGLSFDKEEMQHFSGGG